PRNGKVVGHIINYEFVPVDSEAKSAPIVPDMLSYGSSALVHSVTRDIEKDLLAVYDPADVYAIMSIATLRVIKPSITANRMSTHYNRCFVCKDYPGAAISRNSVGKLFQRIGMDGNRRRLFYQRRMSATAADHHIAIDGTLKQDTSAVNDLSAYSYKARVRGCNDVSVIYAYDIELMEPICAEVFPGNSIDASSYPAFIRDNDIRKGIIVADKGFPPSKIKTELSERPDLHFLTPIKRNDVRIADNDMLSFDGVLEGIDAHVVYKKAQIKGDRFLYAFKDARKAAKEEATYLANAKRKNTFSPEQYAKKKNLFGVIVLESDQDLDAKVAYTCYENRWLLELVFKRYKSDECLDHTGEQGDFSVIGSEFVNFISTVATTRIVKKAEQAGLLKQMSYGELMDDLSSAWRRTDAPKDPSTDDGYWVHTLNTVFEELEALGLSKPAPKPEPKKRGRKPKPKDQIELKPKRPRGRPRKDANQSAGNL
ncbi:MAG: transposase, partial [Lachnospiraceae bacterium]|nr:transposase [Lachnospiraceae bacterium]